MSFIFSYISIYSHPCIYILRICHSGNYSPLQYFTQFYILENTSQTNVYVYASRIFSNRTGSTFEINELTTSLTVIFSILINKIIRWTYVWRSKSWKKSFKRKKNPPIYSHVHARPLFIML